MRNAVGDLRLGPDEDQIARDSRVAPRARDIQLAREANRMPSFRQRAGEAVIAFGIRLAGDHRTVRDERRLVTRPT
jgi:hypothetical protein